MKDRTGKKTQKNSSGKARPIRKSGTAGKSAPARKPVSGKNAPARKPVSGKNTPSKKPVAGETGSRSPGAKTATSKETAGRKTSVAPRKRKAPVQTERKFDRQKKEHRVRFAQNFIKNPALIRRLIKQSSITPNSRVIEIGPGKGTITRELARLAGSVVGVEKDPTLYRELKSEFKEKHNVQLIYGDFLKQHVSIKHSIIFSNPPFNIFSKLIQKIIWLVPFPDDVYLFAQKEAAQRFCGVGKHYIYKILLGPWLDLSVIHEFNREDFIPAPGVDVVLLRITPLRKPLIPRKAQTQYTHFVQNAFRAPKTPLHVIYKKVFTSKQWTLLTKERNLNRDCCATDLKMEQWVSLFSFVLSSVDQAKRKNI